MNKRSPHRTCVGCRKGREREDLIRIVLSPEGVLVPDIKAKLPGRGAYVCCNAACVQKAARKNVLAHSLRKPVESSELNGLEEKIRESLERRILSFLSILMKGKKIVVGRESIRKAKQRGEIYLVLRALNGKDSFSRNGAEDIPVRALFSRERLGSSVGKAPQPLLGVLDQRGSKELLRVIDMKCGLDAGRG